MSSQTPRQRATGLQRPSFGTSTSSPNTHLSASTAVNRKASLRALTGQGAPSTPNMSDASADLDVGDVVNVPGDMHGVVKFIGSVRGKNGRFVGVELAREYAARGKNDGDVDGIRYFKTDVSGAGIFLPAHRAEKRNSPTLSLDSFPPTPTTPSYTAAGKGIKTYTPTTPALLPKFSQSVGPGARPPSPQFKPKSARPSLLRPESPFRKQPPSLAPTPARQFSQSTRGASAPRFTSSPATKGTPRNGASASRTTQPNRPYSRAGSRLGQRNDTIDEATEDKTPVGMATTSNGRTISSGSIPSFSQPLRSPSRLGSAGGNSEEVQRLKSRLEERERQLKDQASQLSEMEASVKELTTLLPQDGGSPSLSRKTSYMTDSDGETVTQLRQMLREKNEKISLLTAEFDAHRADFRSTIDTLEMASSETERVYEEQKRDLLAQLAEMQDLSHSREDVESVARQLKQLEELVAELEEGLEDARRGEAEARGEVEFLRGEVERGRSELGREREKAATALKNAGTAVTSPKHLEQKDDEIRGLKAIIHNLSSTPAVASPKAQINGNGYISDPDELKRMQAALEAAEREKEELRGLAERKALREEELEKELDRLRHDSVVTNGGGARHARIESEMTATPDKSLVAPTTLRARGDSVKATFAQHMQRRSDAADGEDVHEEEEETEPEPDAKPFCEMCESDGHDTPECAQVNGQHVPASPVLPQGEDASSPDREDEEQHHDVGKENAQHLSNGDAAKVPGEEDKWCALCEKDGHLAFDCPEEQY